MINFKTLMMANENPLPQPEDIQWQPLCVSKNMIDPTFCNKKFHTPWKSSIADALNDTLATFIVKTNLEYIDAVKQREILVSQVKEER